jgi:hypothetical protein
MGKYIKLVGYVVFLNYHVHDENPTNILIIIQINLVQIKSNQSQYCIKRICRIFIYFLKWYPYNILDVRMDIP